MPEFTYVVTITTDTPIHADQVITERISFDEEYEDADNVVFDYTIDWEYQEG